MDDITVEVAMQYTTGYHETVMSFANNIHTMKVGRTNRASVQLSLVSSMITLRKINS